MFGTPNNPKTVYILGAGFSFFANAPLQNQVIKVILDLEFNYPDSQHVQERLGRFRSFLEEDLCSPPDKHENVRLEDVFTPIDRCIFDKTSFRSKSLKDLQDLREEIYSLIMLAIKSRLDDNSADKEYINSFAQFLDQEMQLRMEKGKEKHDPVAVISMNWDILLDNSIKDCLDKNGNKGMVDYCCHLSSLEEDETIKPGLWALGQGGYNVKLLKLHGSMNWMHCPQCQRLFVDFHKKLAESLINPAAVKHCKYCSKTTAHKSASQLQSNLIMPTFLKDLNNFQIKLIWQNAGVELSEASHLVFAGYSLPYADFEFRSLLAKSVRKDAHITVVQPTVGSGWTSKLAEDELNRYESFFGCRKVLPQIGLSEYFQSLI